MRTIIESTLVTLDGVIEDPARWAASTLVGSAGASPVRFSQHLRVHAIQRSPFISRDHREGNCGPAVAGIS